MDIDQLPGDAAAGNAPVAQAGQLITGDYVDNHGTAVIAGRVRANGKTIGNAASGATELNGPSTQNLFVWLWNGDPNLVVSGGRGASALADYGLNKTIALPDLNFRTRVGIDGMGASASGRSTGATFAIGSAGVLGSTGGTASEIQTLAQLAGHTHSFTTQASTAHSHSFTTASAGAHNHTGATASAGSHNHSGATATEGAHTHDMSSMNNAGAHTHGGVTGIESASLYVPTGNFTSSASGSRTFGNVSVQAGGSLVTYVSDVFFTNYGSAVFIAPSHTHSISSDGTHFHTGSTGGGTAHSHVISSDGAHTHTISTDGAHVHTGTSDAGGVHTHVGTTDATGSGASQNNMQPFLLITTYIVL